MSGAMISIKDFCDAQARKERAKIEAEKASYAWTHISVAYSDFYKAWTVTGHNNPKHPAFDGTRREGLGIIKLKRDAIEEAKLYAFSTDQEGAPIRAEWIDIYSRDGKWLDSIHAPLSPLKR